MTIDKEVRKVQQQKGYQQKELNKTNLRYKEITTPNFILTETNRLVLKQY